MTKHITILLLCFISITTIPSQAQVSDKNESQAQAVENLNKMKKEFTELEKKIADAKTSKEDPETIKMLEAQLAMMKEMIATMEDITKDLLKTSDNAVTPTLDDNKETVPKRDSKRISMLPDKILTDAELVLFVKKIKAEVEKKISPFQKAQAEIIYTKAKENKEFTKSISVLASLCWMNHYTELALYLGGKACADDITNPDNLNNYAAFLTMTGGEHLAIPILQNLNKKYSGNSTIKNNLGQAWYGLGEMNNAKKFLDTAIKIYPGHSQALVTKASIQKSEGKTEESIESLKRAIRENYTPEKEAALVKLGGKLKYDDIPFKYPAKAEPLGIEKFILMIPDYPMEGGLKGYSKYLEWEDFREKLGAASIKFDAEAIVLRNKVKANMMQFATKSNLLMPYYTPPFKTARRKMELLAEWATEQSLRLDKEIKEAKDTIENWYQEYRNALGLLTEKARASGAPPGCSQEAINTATVFNIKANTLWQDVNAKWLSFQKQFINEQSRLSLYAFIDRDLYELTITTLKIGFLGTLQNLSCAFEIGCRESDKEEVPQKKVLPDFDEMHCEYKTELSVPYYEKVFSIKVECNKMTTKFDLPFIKGEIQENLNTNKMIDVVKGSLEFSQGFSKDIALKGPLSAEMEMKIGAFVEFDNSGITDAGITGELSATIKTQNLNKSIEMEDGTKYSVPRVSEQKLELGIGVRSSLNAGTSASVSGLLNKVIL